MPARGAAQRCRLVQPDDGAPGVHEPGRWAFAAELSATSLAACAASRWVAIDHFHDLRHTGNTLAASDGASLRDLMDRMGHDSVRAAMVYQHATTQASRRIADSISGMIERAEDDDQSGEAGA